MKKLIAPILIVMISVASVAAFANGINYVSYVTIQQPAATATLAQ